MKFSNVQQKQWNGHQELLKDLLFTSENFKDYKFIIYFKIMALPLLLN